MIEPGVMDWLRSLRANGPQRRASGRIGATAREQGLTDFWVLHKPTGELMLLGDLKRLEGSSLYWYQTIDYGNGEEYLTDAGHQALDNPG